MTAPTQSLSSTLARDWILEVLIGSDWTRVRGLTSVSPIFEGALQDESTIDDEGYAREIATGLSYRIEGGGKRKGENTAGFVDDPGQNYLRQLGRKTGQANKVEARIYRRDDLPDAYQGTHPVIRGSGLHDLRHCADLVGHCPRWRRNRRRYRTHRWSADRSRKPLIGSIIGSLTSVIGPTLVIL